MFDKRIKFLGDGMLSTLTLRKSHARTEESDLRGDKACDFFNAINIEAAPNLKTGPKEAKRVGRLMKNNQSGLPGLRLGWRPSRGKKSGFPSLYLTGNYTDANGKARGFSYSVTVHGLDGALKKGLELREKHGMAFVSLADAKTAIHQHFLNLSESK